MATIKATNEEVPGIIAVIEQILPVKLAEAAALMHDVHLTLSKKVSTAIVPSGIVTVDLKIGD